jgi:ABC-type multidrug transport system fused ATPase/permease subunit
MTNRQVLLNLLKPYYKRFALLILAVVFLGILTTSSQVALTPLAEVAVNGGDLQSKLQNQTAQPTLDLNNIGFYIISLISRTTGLTDVWPLLLVSSGIFLALTLLIQVAATGVRYAAIRTEFLIGRDISHRIYSHLLRVPVTVIDDRKLAGSSPGSFMTCTGRCDLQLLLIDGGRRSGQCILCCPAHQHRATPNGCAGGGLNVPAYPISFQKTAL